MVLIQDPFLEREEQLNKWMSTKHKNSSKEQQLAEAVIFAAWPRSEADKKALGRLIRGYKEKYKTKRGVKRVSYDGRGEWLKNAFIVSRDMAKEVEALLMRRGIKYKKWHVVITKGGAIEQPLSESQKNEILKYHVDNAIRTLMQKMDADSREEALMHLFYKLRLSTVPPHQADVYGSMKSYIIKRELFPMSWKQATQKLKQRYGERNSLRALARLLYDIGFLDVDPRGI